jgi:phospholipid/cholesterol/gamma-HCH transport system permease protein
MGAIIVGIVLSGRTAAAYAAELGSMRANEEIDALETSGLSPVELLVVPRMLALLLVAPLLTIYADILAVLGGASVAIGMLKIPLIGFYFTTKHFLAFTDVRMGVVKSVVFGLIVAASGCLRGLTCERDTSGVGKAATSAVVTGILWVVAADAVLGKFFSAGG